MSDEDIGKSSGALGDRASTEDEVRGHVQRTIPHLIGRRRAKFANFVRASNMSRVEVSDKRFPLVGEAVVTGSFTETQSRSHVGERQSIEDSAEPDGLGSLNIELQVNSRGLRILGRRIFILLVGLLSFLKGSNTIP